MNPQVDARRRDCAISAHVDGWAHFSEGPDEFVKAFDQAVSSNRLGVARHGAWLDWVRPAGT